MKMTPADMRACKKVLELKPRISGKDFYDFITSLDYYDCIDESEEKIEELIQKTINSKRK